MKNIIEEIIATRNPRRFKFLSDKVYLSIKYKHVFGKRWIGIIHNHLTKNYNG